MAVHALPTGFSMDLLGLGHLPLGVGRVRTTRRPFVPEAFPPAAREAVSKRADVVSRNVGVGSPAVRALVLHRGGGFGSPERHKIDGFAMNEGTLRKRLGMTCEMVATETLADVEAAILARPADVVFVMVSWKDDAGEVTNLFRRLHAMPDRPTLIFLDYFAPASSPFFGVLPYVDCYCKRQIYRDPSLYAQQFEGGNLLTDYLATEMGYDLEGWDFSSTPDPSQMHKMTHGWNLGVSPYYRTLLKFTSMMPLPWAMRPFAVNCRLGLREDATAKTEWYQLYREHWGRAVAPLKDEFRCTASTRVKLRRYFAEMVSSRIGISPFGWGEVCFRDYEIIASGALLVKPSMEHLKTHPDIFVAGKTYVATSWDGSDVVEICRHYLAHPGEAREIIHNGREALARYFEEGGFVDDIARILDVAAVNHRAVGVSRIRSSRLAAC